MSFVLDLDRPLENNTIVHSKLRLGALCTTWSSDNQTRIKVLHGLLFPPTKIYRPLNILLLLYMLTPVIP